MSMGRRTSLKPQWHAACTCERMHVTRARKHVARGRGDYAGCYADCAQDCAGASTVLATLEGRQGGRESTRRAAAAPKRWSRTAPPQTQATGHAPDGLRARLAMPCNCVEAATQPCAGRARLLCRGHAGGRHTGRPRTTAQAGRKPPRTRWSRMREERFHGRGEMELGIDREDSHQAITAQANTRR